jgi:hypothetical protein
MTETIWQRAYLPAGRQGAGGGGPERIRKAKGTPACRQVAPCTFGVAGVLNREGAEPQRKSLPLIPNQKKKNLISKNADTTAPNLINLIIVLRRLPLIHRLENTLGVSWIA